jgi:hypothetical protein
LETIGGGKFVYLVFPDLEKGTVNEKMAGPGAHSRIHFDGGIVEGSGTTEQVEQEGLYLIVGVVGQEKRRSRKFLRGPRKKLQSGFSS